MAAHDGLIRGQACTLSLSLYIYMYIYRERDGGKERGVSSDLAIYLARDIAVD